MRKNILVACLIVVVVLTTGCSSFRAGPSHTITKTDSVIIREKLVPITVPSTQVTAKFSASQLDSLLNALAIVPSDMIATSSNPSTKIIYYTDPKFKTQISFMLDSLGRLVINCKSLEQQFQAKITEKDHIIVSQEKQIIELKKGFWENVKQFFNDGVWFMIIALIVFTLINLVIKRFVK